MSGMLYAPSIEPMLHNVSSFIHGLFLPDFNIFILSAYADDTVVIVKTKKDVNRLENIVETFGKITAANVNWAQSEALAVGSWSAGLPQLPRGLKWRRGGFKYLGIYLGDDCKEKLRGSGEENRGAVVKVEGAVTSDVAQGKSPDH